MGETRSGKYGRFQAVIYGVLIWQIFERGEDYKAKFLAEVREFVPGTRELDGLSELDINDPVAVAREVKEGWQLMYQEDTSRRTIDAFLETIARDS